MMDGRMIDAAIVMSFDVTYFSSDVVCETPAKANIWNLTVERSRTMSSRPKSSLQRIVNGAAQPHLYIKLFPPSTDYTK